MFTRSTSARLLVILFCMLVLSAVTRDAISASPAQVAYPEKIFANGKAHHFAYKTEDGVTIRYFILKSSDGIIRAAFDACDVCWPENKGYSQKGDFMVCNNCGKKFSSVRINEVQGGCNPAPLNRKVENSSVVLQAADLLQGKRYFDLRGVKR